MKVSLENISRYFEKMRRDLKLNPATIVLAIFILLASLSVFSLQRNSNIAIVNTKEIIFNFTNSISQNSHLSTSQKTQLVKNFSVIYPKILHKYGISHDVYVFDKSALVASPEKTKNITQQIEKEVALKSIVFLKKRKN